ncbi:MAG: PH domain-containing protein [Candidatus Omnitrophica bacterium]|nr:PH domain-containing protein [Candidatus Omnitrophota bacterium]
MYDAFKEFFLYLFCAPAEPPAPPAGTHSSLRIFRASRRFLDYQLVFLILALMVVAAAFLAGTGLVFTRSATLAGLTAFWLICFWILLLMAGWFLIRLEYDMRYYIVTDRSLRIRRGVWTIVEQTLSFINIQNITVEQGPLERFFGIARIVIDTAGGGIVAQPQQGMAVKNHHRAIMAGLDNAQEIRDLIVNYLKSMPQVSGVDGHEGIPGIGKTPFGARGFSEREIEILREIRDEVKFLRGFMAPEFPR